MIMLAPPAAGEGFQIGTPEFDVPPGQEVQDCYFIKLPTTKETWVKRITMAQNAGTHHMNIFRLGSKVDLWYNQAEIDATGVSVVGGGDGSGECWNSANWADWPLVANSQTSDPTAKVNDWQLPDGVGMKFEPGEIVALQTHYVNASTQRTPGKGQVLANFITDDASKFQHELGTIFATNQGIRICPGETDKFFDSTCYFATGEVTITAANSHFHSRGTYFNMRVRDPATGREDPPFYENTSWDSPVFLTDLNAKVPNGGGFKYRCEYTVPADAGCGDPTQDCCFTFGGHVDWQEHCNAFVYYYPKLSSGTTGCF
jgi:hypothetical protein